MRKLIIGTAVCVMLMMTSCDEKREALNDLRDMAKELNENADRMNAEEWEKTIAVYAHLDSVISTNEYTEEELKEIGRLQGECLGHFTKNSVRKIKKGVKKAVSQFQGIMEGFKEAMEEED